MHTPPSSTPQSPHDERSFLFSPTAASSNSPSTRSPITSTPASPTGGALSAAAGGSSHISLTSIHNSMHQSHPASNTIAGTAGRTSTGNNTPSSSSSVTDRTDHDTYTTSRAPSRCVDCHSRLSEWK